MVKKKERTCTCPLCGANEWLCGIILVIVGLVFIAQEGGTMILPEGYTMWPILVFLTGIVILVSKYI